jgi:hypothetical protein
LCLAQALHKGGRLVFLSHPHPLFSSIRQIDLDFFRALEAGLASTASIKFDHILFELNRLGLTTAVQTAGIYDTALDLAQAFDQGLATEALIVWGVADNMSVALARARARSAEIRAVNAPRAAPATPAAQPALPKRAKFRPPANIPALTKSMQVNIAVVPEVCSPPAQTLPTEELWSWLLAAGPSSSFYVDINGLTQQDLADTKAVWLRRFAGTEPSEIRPRLSPLRRWARWATDHQCSWCAPPPGPWQPTCSR